MMMKRFVSIMAALIAAAPVTVHADTTLMPNGVQCYSTANGPLIAGTINTYVPPNTTTNKTTWKDSGQASANTNPITLDGNGCATIFGVGSYRFLIKDSSGNTIYDLQTTDTSASNSVFWAGSSGGTPNVITVTDAGFNGTSGSVIQFLATNTNTSSATLNPSGFGATLIQKDTSAGAVSLTGGEITAGNIISVVYVSSTSSFHLLNTVIASASGSTAPLCGATGLKITNNAGTPSTSIDVTWDSAVTLDTSGHVFSNFSTTTVTINSTTSGAVNQWDGTRPTSNWGNIWLISNGATMGALGSSSATAPTMPSGYTFKCRVGAMYFDGSQNLLRSMQKGRRAQYTVTAATNTAAYPQVGTTSSATPAALSVATVVPPTATSIYIVMVNGTQGANIDVGANNAFTPSNSTTNPPALAASAGSGVAIRGSGSILLESTSIYGATSSGTLTIFCSGWDDKVNAN